jgi:hypothetical protein
MLKHARCRFVSVNLSLERSFYSCVFMFCWFHTWWPNTCYCANSAFFRKRFKIQHESTWVPNETLYIEPWSPRHSRTCKAWPVNCHVFQCTTPLSCWPVGLVRWYWVLRSHVYISYEKVWPHETVVQPSLCYNHCTEQVLTARGTHQRTVGHYMYFRVYTNWSVNTRI